MPTQEYQSEAPQMCIDPALATCSEPAFQQAGGNAFMAERIRNQTTPPDSLGSTPIDGVTDASNAINNGPRLAATVADTVRAQPPKKAELDKLAAQRKPHADKADKWRKRARTSGAGEDHFYYKKKIEKHEKRARKYDPPKPKSPVAGKLQGGLDAFGTVANAQAIAQGVDEIQHGDLGDQASGSLRVAAAGTDIAATAARYMTSMPITPTAAAVAGGLGLASAVDDSGAPVFEERFLDGDKTREEWASEADSLAGVAGRSVAATAGTIACAPIGVAESIGEATAEATLFYDGQDGPKEVGRAPSSRDEVQMCGEIMAGREDNGGECAVVDDQPKQLTPVHTVDGAIKEGQKAGEERAHWELEADRQRAERCKELEDRGEGFKVSSDANNPTTPGGFSVSPGGKAPEGAHCWSHDEH